MPRGFHICICRTLEWRKLGWQPFRQEEEGAYVSFVCEFCAFTLCSQALWPKKAIYGRYPSCKTRYWYSEPVYKERDQCDCNAHSCDNFGVVLCSCSIVSRWKICPICKVYDQWVVIPPELFQ